MSPAAPVGAGWKALCVHIAYAFLAGRLRASWSRIWGCQMTAGPRDTFQHALTLDWIGHITHMIRF